MKKESFENDSKYPAQKRVVPIGLGERGWQAYEPYKKSVDPIESESSDSISVNDAIQYYVENPGDDGKPSNIDMASKMVEFTNGKQYSFDEVIKKYQDDTLQKESDYGFMDGPTDLGKRPKGDFPSVIWMPRGNEDMDVDPNKTTASKKKAELDLKNEPLIQQLVLDYLEHIDYDRWYEFFGENELDSLREEYNEHRTRLSEESIQSHFEDMTEADWADRYEKEMSEIILEELQMAETVEELDERNPGLGKMYVERMQPQKQSALEHPLSQDEQDEIAAKYGPEYNSASLHYYQARQNGHSDQRATAYAVDEVHKQKSHIDQAKFKQIKDTYLKSKVPKSKEEK